MRRSPAAAAGPTALADSPVGARVTLLPVSEGGSRELRMAELGLRRGAQLVVLGRTPGGGRVVGVGSTRIALDRSIARSLTVATTA